MRCCNFQELIDSEVGLTSPGRTQNIANNSSLRGIRSSTTSSTSSSFPPSGQPPANKVTSSSGNGVVTSPATPPAANSENKNSATGGGVGLVNSASSSMGKRQKSSDIGSTASSALVATNKNKVGFESIPNSCNSNNNNVGEREGCWLSMLVHEVHAFTDFNEVFEAPTWLESSALLHMWAENMVDSATNRRKVLRLMVVKHRFETVPRYIAGIAPLRIEEFADEVIPDDDVISKRAVREARRMVEAVRAFFGGGAPTFQQKELCLESSKEDAKYQRQEREIKGNELFQEENCGKKDGRNKKKSDLYVNSSKSAVSVFLTKLNEGIGSKKYPAVFDVDITDGERTKKKLLEMNPNDGRYGVEKGSTPAEKDEKEEKQVLKAQVKPNCRAVSEPNKKLNDSKHRGRRKLLQTNEDPISNVTNEIKEKKMEPILNDAHLKLGKEPNNERRHAEKKSGSGVNVPENIICSIPELVVKTGNKSASAKAEEVPNAITDLPKRQSRLDKFKAIPKKCSSTSSGAPVMLPKDASLVNTNSVQTTVAEGSKQGEASHQNPLLVFLLGC